MEGVLGVLIPILVPLGAFLMVFGLRYMTNKERMALIEKGVVKDFKQFSLQNRIVRWGFLFVGVGVGLLLALMVTKLFFTGLSNEEQTAIYFGFIFISGGIGLLFSHRFEKKDEVLEEKDKDKEQQTIY